MKSIDVHSRASTHRHNPASGGEQKEITVAGDMLVMSKSQMEALGANFRQQAEAIERVVAAIQGGIDGTTWQGARSDQFRTLWESQFKRNLMTLRDTLGEHSVFISRELQAGVNALDAV